MKQSALNLPRWLVGAVLVLSSCMGSALPLIDRPEHVGKGEAVIVGKIQLRPRLQDEDQKLSRRLDEGLTGFIFNPDLEAHKGGMSLLTSDTAISFEEEPTQSDYADRIDAPLEDYFFAVAADSEPFYIVQGVIFEKLTLSTMDGIFFPGSFKVDVRPGDKAVYIGTITFYRDSQFNYKKVVVKDEFEEAKAVFEETMGKAFVLRKRLTRKLKQTPWPVEE